MAAAGRLSRWPFVAVLAVCAGLIGTALYLQHVNGIEPCPLCVFQRMTVVALGAVMLVAALHGPGAVGRRVYGVLTVVVAAVGLSIAGRHVWLQGLPPDQVPECGPGLEYMLQAFPLLDALSMVLEGSGECAEVQWTFLGLAIPGWNLVIFSAVVLFGLYLAFARRPRAGSL